MSTAGRPALEAIFRSLHAGDIAGAEAACRVLLREQPGHADAWYLLGQIVERYGRLEQALDCYERALALIPENTPGHTVVLNRLAESLLSQDQSERAITHLFTALERAPGDDRNWERLGRALRNLRVPLAGARAMLLAALEHPVIRPGEIASTVAASLRDDPLIAELIDASKQDALPRGEQLTAALARLGQDRLLCALMTSAVIPHADYECWFTGLRRALLLDLAAAADTITVSPDLLTFCAALAIQSGLTDYVWTLTPDETVAADRLAARLDAHSTDALTITIVGACRPLHELAGAETLPARAWPAPVAELVRVQVTAPLVEQADRAQIPQLTAIADPVSRQVRAQYEENPYPRWTRTNRAVAPTPLDFLLRTLGGHLPAAPGSATPEILIAGCGTGEQSVFAASCYPDARILAIDLSLASLAYARRMTREAGIGNVEYRHGDIMALAGSTHRFHLIECIGVLHHLADPAAGWRILVDLLHSGGLMLIALYSERGRRMITQARAHIATEGYPATADGIRRCRRELLGLAEGHPLAGLKRYRDLYNLNECRDLLFHVQEHLFTLPHIAEALDHLGLRFLGFSDPPVATHAWREHFPDDPRMQSLEHWHAFETEHPDAFAGMYQFWVQKHR